MKNSILLCLMILLVSTVQAQVRVESADGVEVKINDTSKIITIGGSVTETVFALGYGNKVVATDQSSTYPSQIFALPRVPYVRNLTSEGILSVGASLIIASDDASPKTAINQLRDAGLPVVLVKEEESLEGVKEKLRLIGTVLSEQDKAQTLIQKNDIAYDLSESLIKKIKHRPVVMFVLQERSGSSFMVAGAETGAAKMIELAGGFNAFETFTGYKPVTNEAILSANPDFVLVMESRYDNVRKGLNTLPAVNMINAVQNDAFIAMDGNLLLGFGPRFGEAILALMKNLHPELAAEL